MDAVLQCPFCGKEIELSKALTKEIEEEALAKLEEKHKKELAQVQEKVLAQSAKRIALEFEDKLKSAQEDLIDKDKRNRQLLEQLTQLTEELRKSKREKDEAKLEMQKTLALEEDKIRTEAQKKAEEEQHLKIAEKDKQLEMALKEVEDMRRKLQQGSQQLQGEAFELEFESLLQRQYPNDKVEPVGKGVRGGDVIQEVWDARGNYCGKILWELKNTKTWSEGWIDKLKNDKRSINADEAVLISVVLPTDMKSAGYRNGVWVTKREFVIPLADTLRAKAIQLYYVKNSVHAKDEKMEILYSYLSGTEFKHRVEAIIEAFTHMQDEIEKEKRYFSNKWARDEKNIRMVIDNTYGMHGDLKGIIGTMLPHIRGIELLEDGTESQK